MRSDVSTRCLRRLVCAFLTVPFYSFPCLLDMPARCQPAAGASLPGSAPDICQKDAATAAASSSIIVVKAERSPPSTTTNVKTVVACSLNIFRYDVHLQSQKAISNPPAPLVASTSPQIARCWGSWNRDGRSFISNIKDTTNISVVESEQLLFICPVDTCEAWSLLQPDVEYQVCARCKSEYRFNVDESGKPKASIGHVLMSSYPGCSVSFTPGKVPTITLIGSADLYVTNILDRAWRTMEWRVWMGIFDLTTATEITEKAVWRLLKIARNSQVARAGFIVLPPSHPLVSINEPTVYADLEKAHDAFGEDSGVGVTTRFLH